MTDQRAIMAAQNNADWYSMMFNIHGLQYCRTEIAFLGIDAPPRYHSWMTTLDPDAQADQLLSIRQNAYRPKFGVKDAFDHLALFDENFVELFSASWVFADTIQAVDTAGWTRIASGDELLLWESAWNEAGSPTEQRHFPNAILDRNDVVIWGRRELGRYDAGVIANVSKDCVGLSNCFGPDAYAVAATLCAELTNGALPIVGYERGDDLAAVLDIGFSATGKLRVWNRS